MHIHMMYQLKNFKLEFAPVTITVRNIRENIIDGADCTIHTNQIIPTKSWVSNIIRH